MDAMGNVAQQFGVYWPNFIAQVILFVIVYFVLRKDTPSGRWWQCWKKDVAGSRKGS